VAPCLIFDLDGTLVDSEPLCSQAFLDVLPDLDDTAAGLMHRYRGRQLAEVFDDIAARIGRPLQSEFESQYRSRVAALYDARLVATPGAAEMLAELSSPCCVASNGPPSKMAHGLRVTGLAGFFGDNVFSAYDIGHWKPDPRLFLHAADRMGFAPAQCLVIEDSEAGLLAAKAAGMPALHYSPTGESAAPGLAPVISHFRDLPGAIRSIAWKPRIPG
jgi:HAD superfamily hydrolase (TIGR01509 family)